jgi:putative flippase GtrA
MKPSKEFLRFCLVGIINTLVDVPTFVALHSAGVPVLAANIISTSLALIVSLLLNYHYTFRSRTLSKARVILYFAVTLAGIWIIQPLVITILLNLNGHMHYTTFITNRYGHAKQIDSLIAKLGSLAVSLLWNYLWYSRAVFKKPANETKI